MSHSRVVTFIGEVINQNFSQILKAIEVLRELLDDWERTSDTSLLLKDVRQLIAFLVYRADHHFRLEESIGILTSIVENRPRFLREAEAIKQGQQQMQRELDKLKRSADGLSSLAPATFEAFTVLLDNFETMLLDHQKQENMLVMDAFNQETGGQD